MLDIHTLSLTAVVNMFGFVVATMAIRHLSPQEPSLRDWAMGAGLLALGMLLIGGRGFLPAVVAVVMGNSLTVLGLGYIHLGTRNLLGIGPGRRPWHWLAGGVAVIHTVATTFVLPSLAARSCGMSLLYMAFFAACGWRFWRHGSARLRTAERMTAFLFGGGAVLALIRAVMTLAMVPPNANLVLDPSTVPNWLYGLPYSYAILFSIWMSLMLALMVSARLQQQLAEARDRAEAANGDLTEALEFNEAILLNSPLPMGVYAADGQCVLVNDAYARFVGGTRDDLLAQNFNTIPSWQSSGLHDDCLTALAEHRPQRRDVHIVTTFGKEIWFEYRILPANIHGANHLLVQFSDLTERKRLEAELRQLAFHDALTKLPNRRRLLDRLRQALRAARRNGGHGAVLFLDLNRFKALNDSHGHKAGDLLLIEVADRLRLLVRDSDTVARFGGDEFVVLLEGLGTTAGQARDYATGVADKIGRALAAEYVLGEIRHSGSASVGIRLFSGDDGDPDRLLLEADAAMYEAKKGERTAVR